MFKILDRYGTMKGTSVEIYNLEELGFVAVDFTGSDGTNMEAWKCDEMGYPLASGESMTFKGVHEPISFDDETREPDQWELVGFEKM